ncbi:hypothetical protein Tco_0185112 [Tanacetum coccineum]
MIADLRYFNSLEYEVDFLKSQLKTHNTQFLNEIDRLSREYYYADHMNVILGVYTTLDEFTDLQCDYVDQFVKCERLEKELSKSNITSKSFEALQQHAIDLELALQQYLKAQLQDKEIAISELKKLIENMKGKSVETKFEKPLVIRQPNASQRQLVLGVISTTSVSRPQLKSNQLEDRVMHNNSEGKKQQVEDHRRNFRTKQPIAVPISNREPKRTVNQSAATTLKRTVAAITPYVFNIPSEDPYEEAAQQLFEQAPRSPGYVPENHIPVYIPEPEHPEDLVPAEDEAPTPLLPPFFLSPRIRPLSPRALEVEMRDVTSAYYHSLHPSGTPLLLPIPLPAPSTSRRADIPEADTPPRKRLLLTTPRLRCEIGESSAAAATRQPGPTIETRLRDTERRIMTALELVNKRVTYQVDVCTRESSEFCTRHHDAQKDRAAMRVEIEVLRRERLAYEQEVLETEASRHEWQREAANDLAIQHIMHTQALEAGARVDTLEDTGSSS